MNKNTAITNRSSRGYTNTVLTAIAVLLAVLVLDNNAGMVGPISTASAQSRSTTQHTGGLVSAADQRKTMIAEMGEMNGRLERIERALAKGLNVRIMNAPAQDKEGE